MPLIDFLLERGVNVIIGTSGSAQKFLLDAYPSLIHVNLPAYNVSYSSGSNQLFAIARQIPRLLHVIRKEHIELGKLVEVHQLDGVISDNRYGLWSSEIPSVFICHQLAIALPPSLSIFRKIIFNLHLNFIRKFIECWIPDVEGAYALSGGLSQKYSLPDNFYHIGILSRFLHKKTIIDTDLPVELRNLASPFILAILSGPEPQRTILEKKLIKAADNTEKRILIVQGKPGQKSTSVTGIKKNVVVIPFLQAAALAVLIQKSHVLISRPGYSSIMDYAALGLQKLILIPTPGQTEQELLGQELKRKNIAVVASQADFSLLQCLEEVESTRGFEANMYHFTFQSIVANYLSFCFSKHA